MSGSNEQYAVKISNLKVKILQAEDKVIDYGSFGIKYGNVVLIEGPNGSGKSTFLKTISLSSEKHYSIVEGNAEIYGKSIKEYSQGELHRNVLDISQKDEFQRLESVFHALRRPALTAIAISKDYKEKKKEIDILINHYYKEIICDFFDHKKSRIDFYKANPKKDLKFMYLKDVNHLSGGQQKIIHILQQVIKAKVKGCELALMDEPLNNLDVDNKRFLVKLIKELKENNPRLTFLLISHCRLFPYINATIKINRNGQVEYSELGNELKVYDCLSRDDE